MIELINDNVPILLLDGVERAVGFSAMYFEAQPYLSNPTQIRLSDNLQIKDLDVGPQYLVEANVTILGKEG